MAKFRLSSTLGKYPRLVRSGLVVAFAVSTDQLAKTYGNDNTDVFGLLSFMKPVQAQQKMGLDDETSNFTPIEDFLTSGNSQARVL